MSAVFILGNHFQGIFGVASHDSIAVVWLIPVVLHGKPYPCSLNPVLIHVCKHWLWVLHLDGILIFDV